MGFVLLLANGFIVAIYVYSNRHNFCAIYTESNYNKMSGFLFGMRTDDFVILAADTNAFVHGALKMSKSKYKEYKLGENTYMLCMGEAGDVDSFANWARANCDLYSRKHGYELRPKEIHHWLRQSMADNLRSQDMWRVNSIIGGYDKIDGKSYLSMIDYLATNIPNQNYISYGFPGQFSYAILDNMYRPDLTEQQGLDLVQRLLDQIKHRVIIDFTEYRAIVINADGSRVFSGLKPTVG